MEASMRTIGAFDAKNSLGALLDLVEQGEEIVITRRGKPVARLVPEAARRDRARAAVAAIRAARQGVTLGGIPLKALIEDGRP
jgi:prevent-host-death family protein